VVAVSERRLVVCTRQQMLVAYSGSGGWPKAGVESGQVAGPLAVDGGVVPVGVEAVEVEGDD
jgi:hypothetical protein